MSDGGHPFDKAFSSMYHPAPRLAGASRQASKLKIVIVGNVEAWNGQCDAEGVPSLLETGQSINLAVNKDILKDIS